MTNSNIYNNGLKSPPNPVTHTVITSEVEDRGVALQGMYQVLLYIVQDLQVVDGQANILYLSFYFFFLAEV